MPAAAFPKRLNALSPPLQTLAVAAGMGVMAVASQVAIPLPEGVGVPITLQTYALLVLAGLMGGRLALITVLAWLAIAALGAPVLADGAGGWRAVTGMTAGFLVGMATAAWLCGRGAERVSGVWSLVALFLAGHVVVLMLGWAGLVSLMDPGSAFEYGILPFLPGAVVKSIAAALTVRWVAR
jgi:biotin transport system substrate-specific component